LSFLLALKFLTIIPLPWRREASPQQLGGSVAYFPAVGVIIGLILAGLNWLLTWVLPAEVVNVLLVVLLVVLTGALHLDGFVDTCDGIAGHKSPEERLRVMRDSRAGGFGIIGVCCLILVKFLALNSLPEGIKMASLILMPTLSRWAMVYSVFAYPYARPSGLGKVFKEETSFKRFILATLTALVAAAVLGQLYGFIIMLAIWVITLAMAAYLKRKFAGLTGDTYGAINEVAEVSVLILTLLLAQSQLVLPSWG